MQIPKLIHQCWFGDEPIPVQFQAWAAKWRELHPDWDYHLWTHETARPMLKNLGRVYDKVSLPVSKADLTRLELVYQLGGVYADMDVEPIKPIDGLLGEFEAFATFEPKPPEVDDPWNMNQAIFGAVPRHKAIKDAMIALANGLAIDERVLWCVRSFTDAMKRHATVTLFPRATFHPYTYQEIHRGQWQDKQLEPYTYGIHWLAGSWKTQQVRDAGLGDYPAEEVDLF